MAWGLGLAVLCSGIVAGPTAASGGFSVYTDRTAFEAAATAGGGAITSEDFNAITADLSFQMADGPKSVGPLTFTEIGATAGTANGAPNRVDADPFETSGIFSGDDTTYVYLAVNADDDNPGSVYGVDLDFVTPASAFGGDFTDFISAASGPSEEFRLTLLGTAAVHSFVLPTPASSGTNFFGIVSDTSETFAGIAFSADAALPSRRGTVGLDNAAVVLVPEPATATLVLLGGLMAIRRRRPALA